MIRRFLDSLGDLGYTRGITSETDNTRMAEKYESSLFVGVTVIVTPLVARGSANKACELALGIVHVIWSIVRGALPTIVLTSSADKRDDFLREEGLGRSFSSRKLRNQCGKFVR